MATLTVTPGDAQSLLAVFASAPDGASVYVPAGTYSLPPGANLDMTGRTIHPYGDGPWKTLVIGNTPGATLDCGTAGTPAGPVVGGMYLRNTHATGTAVRYCGRIGGAVEHCRIVSKQVGLDMRANVFSAAVRSCRFEAAGNPAGSIGILCGSHTHLDSVDVVGWDVGVRLWGVGPSITSMRCEVNRVGLQLGVNDAGQTWALSCSHLCGLSFEANDTAVEVRSATSTVLTAWKCHGSPAAPSGQSVYALRLSGGTYRSEFGRCELGGGYSGATVSVAASFTHMNSRLVQVGTNNGGVPNGVRWEGVNPPPPGLAVEMCDNAA